MTHIKLIITLSKEKYTLQDFINLIDFLIEGENLNNAYWITTSAQQIPMQQISITTAYTQNIYNGFAIIY